MSNSQPTQQRTWTRPAFRLLTVLMFALVAIQPLLGGWGWFRDRDFIDIHAMVANTIFLISVVLVVLAFLSGFRRKMWLAAWSIVLLLMVTAQMGLGYSSEGRPSVAALHIPVGVFTFGVSLLLMLFAYGFTANRDAA